MNQGRQIRAVADSLIGFFALIILVGLMFAIIDPAAEQLLNAAENQTTRQQGNDTITSAITLWNNVPLLLLVFGVIGIIAAAVFEGRPR